MKFSEQITKENLLDPNLLKTHFYSTQIHYRIM